MAKKEKSSEQQLKELCKEIKLEIDRWHSLRTQGGHNPFYGDGYNMNLTRNHVIYDKGKIKELCEENSLDLPEEYHIPTPPKVPNYYMAKPKQIEKDARESLAKYKSDENYQWLLRCNTSTNVKKKTCYEAVMGYVSGLEEAIKIGDLVAMRRHRNPEAYLGSFAECRKRIEEAMAEETLDGQMELFDFI